MSAGEPNARVAECGVCGAPLVIDVRNHTAHCSACGAEARNFSVDGGSRYRPAIEDETAVERFELERIQSAKDRAGLGAVMFWLVGLASLTGYWVIDLATGLAIGHGGLFDLSALLVSVVVANRCANLLVPQASKLALDSVDVPAMTRCTECGADVLFPAGATTVTCPYCSANVMEPRELELSRLDRLKRRVEQATWAADSAEFGGEEPANKLEGLLFFVGLLVAGVLLVALYSAGVRFTPQQMSFALLIAASVGVGVALVGRKR